ncbi:MAG: rod-binding protein [Phycisphaerales bacterium]|nr:MAG: rod-binding protein [Phycisphaerales bacterium]
MKSIADIATSLPGPVNVADRLKPSASRSSDDVLTRKAREFVGLTFFAPLLKQASDPVLKGKYLHGGRGEQVFRGQLNELLAMRIGQSSRLGIAEALVRQLNRDSSAQAAGGLDLEA